MKLKTILYALLAVLITSCSSAYRASQTPDDVYYSPTRALASDNDKKDDRKNDKYEEYTSAEDRYLKMKVRDRQRWGRIDDYDYWYDSRYNPYAYDYYRRPGLSVYAWNGWYSPYYHPFSTGWYNPHFSPYSYYGYGYPANVYIIKNPAKTNVVRPNLNGYRNNGYNNTNNTGSTLKRIFAPNPDNDRSYNNSNNGSYRSTDRSYTPSSGGSSSGSRSSSGGSSSGGGVSRPGRP